MFQTPNNLLATLASLPPESTFFSAEDLTHWGNSVTPLKRTQILTRAQNATSVLCPCGEHWGEIIHVESEKSQRMYVSCPHTGCEEVLPEAIQRWKFNVQVLPQILCKALSLPPPECFDAGRLWKIGVTASSIGFCELWFTHCRAGEDFMTPLGKIPTSSINIIIYLGERPTGYSNVVPLELVLRLENDKEEFDFTVINSHLEASIVASRDKNACIFQRKGEMWDICFDGKTVHFPIKDGLAYLSYLLSHPGQEISVTTLRALTSPGFQRETLGNAGDACSKTALSSYQQRLVEINEALEEARENNDLGLTQHLLEEQYALTHEVAHSAGLRGRIRTASNDFEKIRKAVQKSIQTAITGILEQHKALGEYLRSHIRTGGTCSYSGPKGERWIT